MASEFRIGSALGIPIKVHWTLLLFLPVLGFIMALQLGDVANLPWSNWFPWVELDPDALQTQTARLVAGFVAAVGLFVSVLLHELGHAVEAKRHDIEVERITLWLFGGLAHMKGITRDPAAEARIAIAGPIVSLALGAMPAAFLLVNPGAYVTLIVVYLAGLNVVLAIFNMLPAFPLDGGRLLRAILAARMPFSKATQIAANVGKGMAVLMGLAGLFGSVWLILIALFIYMAASQEAQGVALFDALDKVQVHEIMDADIPGVAPDSYVEDLVPLMLSTRSTGFPVLDGDTVVGVVTLSDIQDVPEEERSLVRVEDVMTEDLLTVEPHAKASDAMRTMMEADIGRLLVVRQGQIEGVVTRQGIMQAFQVLQTLPPGETDVRGTAETVDPEGTSSPRW